MRTDLEAAFSEGKPVTARVKWLAVPTPNGEARGCTRWVHCTPLIHVSGGIGMWMVVLVLPEEGEGESVGSIGPRSSSRLEKVHRQRSV